MLTESNVPILLLLHLPPESLGQINSYEDEHLWLRLALQQLPQDPYQEGLLVLLHALHPPKLERLRQLDARALRLAALRTLSGQVHLEDGFLPEGHELQEVVKSGRLERERRGEHERVQLPVGLLDAIEDLRWV